MAFTVYPAPPTAPLAVAPGASSPFFGFPEQAQLDPQIGGTRMYIAVGVSGDGCTPPGPPAPTVLLDAGATAPVAVAAGHPAMIVDAGGDLVGRATATAVADGVLLIEVELVRHLDTWAIRFDNPDPAAPRQVTWVVADNAAETRQPWIDGPGPLQLVVPHIGAMTTAPVPIANRGTAPLAVTDPMGTSIGPGMTVAAVPGPVGPGTCGHVLISFKGLLPGTSTGAYTITSNDPRATGAAGHNHVLTVIGDVQKPI